MRTLVALDVETTGLDAERDAIIEIGAVKFRGETELDTFQTLVNPGRPIPYRVSQLTGLTDADVRGAPRLQAALRQLAGFVGNLPLVGHNIGFDVRFLRRHGVLETNPAIDTFELATILMPYVRGYGLQELAQALELEVTSAHRALVDAQTARALFMALLDKARRLGLGVIQEVSRLAGRSDWQLAPIFQDLARERARRTFEGTLGDQLAAKLGGRERIGLFLDGASDEELEPVARPSPLDVEELAAYLALESVFSKRFEGFEHRPQQVQMLRSVVEALNEPHHLLIEAGTGTGKSLAYLLPAVRWGLQNKQRVVVSTNTINLQDQLLHKDVPLMREVLGWQFKAVALKGRSNYLCVQRLEQLKRREGHSPVELRFLAKVMVWLPGTLTGDRQELFMYDADERRLWEEVAANSEQCPLSRCQRMECFFWRRVVKLNLPT